MAKGLQLVILCLSMSFLVADNLLCTEDWQMTATGYHYTLGLTKAGKIYAWGWNIHGQLGIGTNDSNIQKPTPVMPNNTFKLIAAKVNSSFAISTNGSLYGWGRNDFGQLGINNTDNQIAPVQIGNDSDWKTVSPGARHALALKQNGSLYVWGADFNGQLGNGINSYIENPVQIESNYTFKTVSAGEWYSMAIRSDDTLWGWGGNWNGQLGDNTTAHQRSAPVQIGTNKWREVSAGYLHTLALDLNGTLYGWGRNYNGWLGVKSKGNSDVLSPVQINNATWKAISSGDSFSLGIQANGSLWSWGFNYAGQLGNGNTNHSTDLINIGKNLTWKNIAAGSLQSIGITIDGQILSWGENSQGELGIGTFNNTASLNECPKKAQKREKSKESNKIPESGMSVVPFTVAFIILVILGAIGAVACKRKSPENDQHNIEATPYVTLQS